MVVTVSPGRGGRDRRPRDADSAGPLRTSGGCTRESGLSRRRWISPSAARRTGQASRRLARPIDNTEVVSFNFVGPRFFETLGIPLIAGRDLQLSDDAGSRPVAVISQSLASRYFPGRPAVGAQLQSDAVVAEIVGVAKDVPYEGVRREREQVVYRPYSQGRTPACLVPT